MSGSTPYAGIAGAPQGIVQVQTVQMILLNQGSPVGVLPGTQGNATTPPTIVWDWTTGALWICTSGSNIPANVGWGQVGFLIAGGGGSFSNLLATGAITLVGTNVQLFGSGSLSLGASGTMNIPLPFTDYLGGLNLSNDGTSPNTVLDIEAGTAMDGTNVSGIRLASPITKTTGGVWVAGTGSAGMGKGLTIAASTWYHVFLILNGVLGDVYFDTSPTAANIPTGVTKFRRIGSFKTDVSSHILAFKQNGDTFTWATGTHDVAIAAGTVSGNQALNVPPGFPMNALFRAIGSNASAWEIVLSSPNESSVPAPSVSNANLAGAAGAVSAGQFNILTDASGNIVAAGSVGSQNLNIYTYGWVDTRGRLV